MQAQPAAVAVPSRFKRVAAGFRLVGLCGVMGFGCLSIAFAAPPKSSPAIVDESPRFLARIQLHSAEEIERFLIRAEQLHQSHPDAFVPVAFVLHGPEVKLFESENYDRYSALVDRAARLDAFNLIDVKVCQTYMNAEGIKRESLPPFVDIVPYGPSYEQELKDDGYVEF